MRITTASLPSIQSHHRRAVQAKEVGVAIHEAGHAVVAMALGYRVAEIHMRRAPDSPVGFSGACITRGVGRLPFDDEDAVRLTVHTGMIDAGGAAALSFLDGAVRSACGQHWEDPYHSDHRAMQKTFEHHGDVYGSFWEYWDESYSGARKILERHRQPLDVLASALLWRSELDADDIAALVPTLVPPVDAEPEPVRSRPPVSLPDPRTMSQEQRDRIADALEQLLSAHVHRGPTYRVGDRTIETRVGGPVTLTEGRQR